MASVRLPVQAAGGHPDVEAGGVRGERLQQVEDVKVDDLADLGLADVHERAFPQPVPGVPVLAQQLLEAGCPPYQIDRVERG